MSIIQENAYNPSSCNTRLPLSLPITTSTQFVEFRSFAAYSRQRLLVSFHLLRPPFSFPLPPQTILPTSTSAFRRVRYSGPVLKDLGNTGLSGSRRSSSPLEVHHIFKSLALVKLWAGNSSSCCSVRSLTISSEGSGSGSAKIRVPASSSLIAVAC